MCYKNFWVWNVYNPPHPPTGLIVVYGLIVGQPMNAWTVAFLTTTVLTSATGFGFPFERFLPSHALGVISLVVLGTSILARYMFNGEGAWRWIYVVTAVLALYINVFVLIVQAFQKVPALKAKAPTQSEPPFVIAQVVTLAVFVAIGIAAIVRYYP